MNAENNWRSNKEFLGNLNKIVGLFQYTPAKILQLTPGNLVFYEEIKEN